MLELADLVKEELASVKSLRRRLHMIPESSFSEVCTADFIIKQLREAGLNPIGELAGTGVIADLDTGHEGPYIIVRADMDALPLEEDNDLEHKSVHEGFAHCCGHDGHMATVLGLARILTAGKNDLTGTVRFLFQPAEEKGTGALRMIEAGALGARDAAAMLAVHASPGLPVGTVACRPGVMTAAMATFTIHIRGTGGHSARPERACNPLTGIGRLVEALHSLTGGDRVVTICVANAGNRDNIIPEEGYISGTCRSLDPDQQKWTCREIVDIATRLCEEVDLSAEVEFKDESPSVMNDEHLFELFMQVGKELEPAVHTERLQEPSMGSEDFAHYQEHAPALFLRVGMGVDSPELHTPTFEFNDKALEPGILILAALIKRIQEEN